MCKVLKGATLLACIVTYVTHASKALMAREIRHIDTIVTRWISGGSGCFSGLDDFNGFNKIEV